MTRPSDLQAHQKLAESDGTLQTGDSSAAADPLRTPVSKAIARRSVFVLLCAGWFAMVLFAFSAFTVRTDVGDTWIALACGRHHVNHGVDTVDPFSANALESGPTAEQIENWPHGARWLAGKIGLDAVQRWHPTGWINQNWLSHVLFYKLVTWFGSDELPHFNALLYLKFTINLLVILCVYRLARVLGVHPALATWCSCFAMFVGRGYTGLRPHDFSNLFVPTFVLIIALATYRKVILIWLVVPLAVLWANLHGGYIYIFIMLTAFMMTHSAMAFLARQPRLRVFLGRHTHLLKPGVIWHFLGASVLAFLAMLLFNPFHLTNVTHIFEISLSENASYWREINEWKSVWEESPYGPLGPFFAMLLVCLLVFVALLVMKTIAGAKRREMDPEAGHEGADPVRIDLRLLVIAVLTIYMAVSSRRFIAIAAFVSCPLFALYLQQAARGISHMTWKGRLGDILAVPKMNAWARTLSRLSIVYVLCFGVSSAYAFGRQFVLPLSYQASGQTVFERMLSAHTMPVGACAFLRENGVTGKMFNVWREGGYIAWAQGLCGETGKADVELFIDGRAQAAYDPSWRREWTDLMACRPIPPEKGLPGPASKERRWQEIGDWAVSRLRGHGVTLALLPMSRDTRHMTRALDAHPDWCVVYVDGKHRLFVDQKTPWGQRLVEGIPTGQTRYGNAFARELTLACYHLGHGMAGDALRQGFGHARAAFRIKATQCSASLITRQAGAIPEFEAETMAFCKEALSALRNGTDRGGHEQDALQQGEAAKELERFLRSRQDVAAP
ncbi:MAG: hypothetical protein IIC50_24660 [Planctomycetes bacterium]|nr:hypothetical protein [Planctomycetota bacterium]